MADADAFSKAAGRRKAAPAVTTAPEPIMRKYTVLIEQDLADNADAVVLKMRRQAGRRLDKASVVRELLAMLVDDKALQDEVAQRLAAQKL